MADNFYKRNGMDKGVSTPEKEKANTPKVRIGVTPCEMEGCGKTKLVTTDQLCRIVNKLFTAQLPEYAGCRIYVDGYRTMTDLFFSEQPANTDFANGKIRMIIRKSELAKRPSSNFVQSMQSYNSRNKDSVYELTEEGKQVLFEFINRDMFGKNNNINWKSCAKEVSDNTITAMNCIYMMVSVDISKIMEKIYGKKAKNDSRYYYDVYPARPLMTVPGSNGNFHTVSWLFNITQINDKELQNAMQQAGLTMNQGFLGIVRP